MRAPIEVLLAMVRVRRPDEVLASFTSDRIREVCIAAVQRKHELRNPGGWVRRALSQGWEVAQLVDDKPLPGAPGQLLEEDLSSVEGSSVDRSAAPF